MRQQTGDDYGNKVLAELKRLDVPLPDKEQVLRERLNAHQRRREAREGAFAEPHDVELLLDKAGFSLKSCTLIDVDVAAPMKTFIAKISKRRFMAIAEGRAREQAR
jgi:hypothetical protein